jgi:hypothetical protein
MQVSDRQRYGVFYTSFNQTWYYLGTVGTKKRLLFIDYQITHTLYGPKETKEKH